MSPGKMAGFTLIELLVVMVIIAVIAGLLLGALQAARESSRSVKCQSNLHQIIVAMNGYLEDHNESYFWGNGNGSDGSIERFRWGGREINNKGGAFYNSVAPRPLNVYMLADGQQTNLTRNVITACPSDKGRWATAWTSSELFAGTSYTFNAIGKQSNNGSAYVGGLVSLRASTIYKPSEIIVFMEDPLNYLGNPGWHKSDSDSGNAAFADGHVASLFNTHGPRGNGWTFINEP